MGVKFELETPVEEVIIEGKTVKGVRTSDVDFMADKVIMNADFAHAMTTMIPNQKRKKWSNRKLRKKSYSCSTFMLYLGVNKLYDEPHHQIYASADYENSPRDIDNHKILGMTLPYMSKMHV